MSEISGIQPPEAIKKFKPQELGRRVVDNLSHKKDSIKRGVILGTTAASLMFTAACGEIPPSQPGPGTQATHAMAEGMRTASNYFEAAGPPIDKKLEEIATSPQAREAQQKADQAKTAVKQGADQARRTAIEALGGTPKP